jgi:hypothetical protein
VTISPNIPRGVWAAFLYEMKKYKSFRAGYHDGQVNKLQSIFLTEGSDSSYRHKLGVLVACYEAGIITDIRLDRRNLSVTAFNGEAVAYSFTSK